MEKSTGPDNIAIFSSKAEIKEEAAAWIVQLDQGGLSEAKLREFEAWMGRSQMHRNYLLKLAANWEAMGVMEELADLFPLPGVEPPGQPLPSGRGKVFAGLATYLRLPLVAGAVSAVLLAAVLLIYQGAPDHAEVRNIYATSVGEQSQYTLEDGSGILLNTDSVLKVDYGENWRAVHLLRGEASFEVAKNPDRPFVVYSGGGMIWAVGTAFNVRYTSESVDVVVTEGTVKVFSNAHQDAALNLDSVVKSLPHSQPGAPGLSTVKGSGFDNSSSAVLSVGQAVRYNKAANKVEMMDEQAVVRKLSWMNGALVFKGETLAQALDEIARYTDKQFVIVDPSISQLKVGGRFKTDDIDALLQALGEALPIRVEAVSSQRIQLSAL
jgi:transmembrane sensor